MAAAASFILLFIVLAVLLIVSRFVTLGAIVAAK